MKPNTTMFSAGMIPDFSNITPEGAKKWWDDMLELGLYINPDDGAEDYIHDTGERVLDDEAANKVNAIYDQMFSVIGEEETFDIGVTAWRRYMGHTWDEKKQEWVS